MVACTNSNGEPELVYVTVECTDDQYNDGYHYVTAKERVIDAGYELPAWVADENDPGFVPRGRERIRPVIDDDEDSEVYEDPSFVLEIITYGMVEGGYIPGIPEDGTMPDLQDLRKGARAAIQCHINIPNEQPAWLTEMFEGMLNDVPFLDALNFEVYKDGWYAPKKGSVQMILTNCLHALPYDLLDHVRLYMRVYSPPLRDTPNSTFLRSFGLWNVAPYNQDTDGITEFTARRVLADELHALDIAGKHTLQRPTFHLPMGIQYIQTSAGPIITKGVNTGFGKAVDNAIDSMALALVSIDSSHLTVMHLMEILRTLEDALVNHADEMGEEGADDPS